jgi:hypothetical protein
MTTMFDQSDIHEMLTQFKNELIKELESKLPKQSGMQEYKILKSKDLKRQLAISDSTIENLRNNGLLNYSKVGGTYFYYQSDVNAMLERNKTQFTNNSNQ